MQPDRVTDGMVDIGFEDAERLRAFGVHTETNTAQLGYVQITRYYAPPWGMAVLGALAALAPVLRPGDIGEPRFAELRRIASLRDGPPRPRAVMSAAWRCGATSGELYELLRTLIP